MAGRLNRHIWRVGVFLGVAALVAAPILIYFALHPEHFLARSSLTLCSILAAVKVNLSESCYSMCGSIFYPLVFSATAIGATTSPVNRC